VFPSLLLWAWLSFLADNLSLQHACWNFRPGLVSIRGAIALDKKSGIPEPYLLYDTVESQVELGAIVIFH
jgi:hypothetical protein